jgi:chromosome segregation and condensation protein ScpB
MAEAKKVLKEVMVKTVKPTVELSLSYEEAEVLALILCCIGGDPYNTMRKQSQDILEALRGQDIDSPALREFQNGDIIASRKIRDRFYKGTIVMQGGSLEDFKKALPK